MPNNQGKNIDYYLCLPYEIRVRMHNDPLEGQVFVARVSEIDGCMSHGKTREEALANIQVALREWVEDALQDGDPIPEPTPEPQYSGRLLLRMPSFLHRKIAEQAAQMKMSINQYVLVALTEQATHTSLRDQVSKELSEKLQAAIKELKWETARQIQEISVVAAARAFNAHIGAPQIVMQGTWKAHNYFVVPECAEEFPTLNLFKVKPEGRFTDPSSPWGGARVIGEQTVLPGEKKVATG